MANSKVKFFSGRMTDFKCVKATLIDYIGCKIFVLSWNIVFCSCIKEKMPFGEKFSSHSDFFCHLSQIKVAFIFIFSIIFLELHRR